MIHLGDLSGQKASGVSCTAAVWPSLSAMAARLFKSISPFGTGTPIDTGSLSRLIPLLSFKKTGIRKIITLCCSQVGNRWADAPFETYKVLVF